MSRRPDPPTIGPAGLPVHNMHDLVALDAIAAGYRTLAAVVADQGRAWQREHGEALDTLIGDDPMVAAVLHLADALARLQQGVREKTPRAAQHYEAVLLIAGHMAREAPFATYRRTPPHQPGRAA